MSIQKAFLSRKDKDTLETILKKGTHNIFVIKRAKVLLKADIGWACERIAQYADYSEKTVQRRISRYRQGGLHKALYDDPRPGQPRKLNDEAEAFLVATACSDPPEESARWTLELLKEKLIKEKKVKNISTVALWKHLRNRGIKPWLEKNVVHS
jgi:transposase